MVADYESSKDIKHPRDVGNRREEILAKFLRNSGYMPARYGISDRSVRVSSPSGHLSKELDLVIFDAAEAISLMRRGRIYEVLPIESVYGVIQVKSRLNKIEIKNGLDNIASFKQMTRPMEPAVGFFTPNLPRSARGFGILFSYDSDLEWLDIIAEIESFARSHPRESWCNAVFILNKGFIIHGEANRGYTNNSDIEKIVKLTMHGYPDLQELNLYQLYSTVLRMTRDTIVFPPNIDRYFRLPLTAGQYSYTFQSGMFAEIAVCNKRGHGDYQREFAPDQLKKVIEWCQTTVPINWIKAIDIAYGKPENPDAYARQPRDIRIYNPEGRPLNEILLAPPTQFDSYTAQPLGFDIIECSGLNLAIPFYYEVKEGLLNDCPKCIAAARRASRAKNRQHP